MRQSSACFKVAVSLCFNGKYETVKRKFGCFFCNVVKNFAPPKNLQAFFVRFEFSRTIRRAFSKRSRRDSALKILSKKLPIC